MAGGYLLEKIREPVGSGGIPSTFQSHSPGRSGSGLFSEAFLALAILGEHELVIAAPKFDALDHERELAIGIAVNERVGDDFGDAVGGIGIRPFAFDGGLPANVLTGFSKSAPSRNSTRAITSPHDIAARQWNTCFLEY